ncbi:MAG: family 16 glycosylhydrolase [Vicingaceae bacterium]|nr:family 16 glycosylhydrolase [Vicingaceae bacterium]
MCNPNPYILTFEDNFNGNSLDLNEWRLTNQPGALIGGDSYQIYTLESDNVEVSGGTLKIIANNTAKTRPAIPYKPHNQILEDGLPNLRTYQYSSSAIWSHNFYREGKYEIKCRVTKGKGLWPAFWLFDGDSSPGGSHWSELDFFELYYDKDSYHNSFKYTNNIHFDLNNDGNTTNEKCSFEMARNDLNNWHTFTCYFTSDRIDFYIDNIFIHRKFRYINTNAEYKLCKSNTYQTQAMEQVAWPRSYMNIVLNMAIETSKTGNPPNSQTFPGVFEIDYVRYWRQEPVQTPPCLVPNTRKLANGFLINGKRDKVIEICLNDPIILSGVHPNPSCPQLISPNIHPENRSIFGSCSDNDAFQCNSNIISCICWFSSLFISVTLVNDNLTPVGPEFTKWQNFKSPDLINVGGINGEFYLNPIDLRNYLPSPYIIFQSGQTYRIKIANSDFNGWSEYTNYIHFFTNNRTITGQNITSNVYGKNITISNSTVSQPIEVVASESIVILPNSTLNLGTYRIDEGLNCNSFLRVDVPNNETYSKGISNNSLYYQSDKEFEVIDENSIAPINDKVHIFPNPTSGNFTITQLEQFAGGNITITNLMGQVVLEQQINVSTLNINLANQPKGIYLVRINSQKESVVQKVVVE